MTTTRPNLQSGRVYRTRDLARWTANPSRLAAGLVASGELEPLTHGLFVRPRRSRFGPVPPTDEEVMRAFLDGGPFVFTGPERWNALGLGTSATFAEPLVYNTKRSGEFTLGRRRYLLRRVAFPRNATPEWYVVDLFQHAEQAAASRDALTTALARAVRAGRFDRGRLTDLARRYGSKDTEARIAAALRPAAEAA